MIDDTPLCVIWNWQKHLIFFMFYWSCFLFVLNTSRPHGSLKLLLSNSDSFTRLKINSGVLMWIPAQKQDRPPCSDVLAVFRYSEAIAYLHESPERCPIWSQSSPPSLSGSNSPCRECRVCFPNVDPESKVFTFPLGLKVVGWKIAYLSQ